MMRGTQVLLDHAQATVYPGQKVGIIGRNGCGKSSLFSAITGSILGESGKISLPKDTVIAQVSQQTPALDISAKEYVIQGDRELSELNFKRDQAYASGDGEKIALIEDEIGCKGGWTISSRAEELLHGLGFAESEMQKAVKEFSGGWRMRLNLAQALICRSKLLLLDEPTNHLDL
ncbi:MAG: ATP-binding cassette domain-containing protein, partial [Succinatimonas sp.]|nr:ATP-binding cassette domain-containing protein [Succinatimonas sp.]